MAKLTLTQLERHLFAAADIVRGTMDVAEYRDFLLALLLLKRVNDEFEAVRDGIIAGETETGATREETEEKANEPSRYTARRIMYVPEMARWERLAGVVDDVAKCLHIALDELAGQNGNERLRGLFEHVDFNRIGGGVGTSATRSADKRLAALISHFGSLRLRDEDLESPYALGAAYEYLLKAFTDSAGARGGEFHTPRGVVRMMVELARPRAGQRVYDPCVGSGGMLIHAKEYVEEHGGAPEDLTLAGQDVSRGSWAMATLNMLFHGVGDFDLRTGDALTAPLHLDQSYDVVLSNPPFSMNYRAGAIKDIDERMPYGRAPEKGKADLMFLQHMLHTAKQRGGSVFTVMPHGVLFRGGAEEGIRARLIEDDLLEAVIGLPPNLFHGTGIPACVLVLRAPGAKAPERRGKVLFINADREYHREAAQNVLLPEHTEKIASIFHAFTEVERLSRVVSREELEANHHNLNVRKYVDNTPLPELQDIGAYMQGGVPVAEIEASRSLLEAYGIEVRDLFAVRSNDHAYVDFLPGNVGPDVAGLAGPVSGREQELWAAFEEWWASEKDRIATLEPVEGDDLAEHESRARLARLRADLIHSFQASLLAVGLLDRHALAGAVAGWWHDTKSDLRALSVSGFAGVTDSWVEFVEAMLAPEEDPLAGRARARTAADRSQAYGHKVVAAIVPGFLDELKEARDAHAELGTEVKEAQAALEQARAGAEAVGEGAGSGGTDSAPTSVALAEAGLRSLKRQWSESRKAIAALEADFQPRLNRARHALVAERGERGVVLGILRNSLAGRLKHLVTRRRRELAQTYERWQEKYRLSFREIENQLYGTSVGMAQSNPWSQRPAWNLSADSVRTASGRREIAAAVHELIDAEKAAEAALAKLEFDELTGPLVLLQPGAEDDRAKRLPLREALVPVRTANWIRARPTAVGIPVIRLANLTVGGLDLDPSRLHRLDAASEAGPLLLTGDVLLAAVAVDKVFRAAVWQGQLDRAAFGAQIVCLRPRANLLSPHYLAAWLRLPHVQRRIFDVARESVSGMTVLNVGRLLDVEMELPSRMGQPEFDRQVEVLHEQMAVRHRQLAKLRLIREALTGALTGWPSQ